MTKLIKINHNHNFNDYNILHQLIRDYISNNKNKYGLICLDYRNRIRRRTNILIPFNFCNKIIFKYIDTFQQNNSKIANKLRKYVLSLIKTNKITCIGGESYIYGLIKNCSYNYYTNSEKLFIEAEYNTNFSANLINYNNIYDIYCYNTVIINLSKLNINLLKLIKSKYIIIINCHHKDFWKKIRFLNKYKLIKRHKFIANNHFITVNLFVKSY